MSLILDEKSIPWKEFRIREGAKFPHFGKDWFDYNGEISGDSSLPGYKSWRWEVKEYLKDRTKFLEQLQQASSSNQIERPPEKKIPQPAVSEKKIPHVKQSVKKPQRDIPRNEVRTEKKVPRPNPKNYRGLKQTQINVTSTMPRRTKRSQAWRRRRGGRRSNKALSSVKVPFKMVMEVNSAKSGAESGHWHNHLTINELAGPALKLHEEFKVCSMKVRFIPEDITSGAGLYAACLLDQGGFGDPASSTTTWFPRVADLPGARLCHVTRGCMFTWRPTEPDSRNYRKADTESNYIVASFYIFGNSAKLALRGQLLITGLLRARGEYYAANIASRIKALSLLNAPDGGRDDLESLSD